MKIFYHKGHYGHEGIKPIHSQNLVYFPGIARDLLSKSGRCVPFVVKTLG